MLLNNFNPRQRRNKYFARPFYELTLGCSGVLCKQSDQGRATDGRLLRNLAIVFHWFLATNLLVSAEETDVFGKRIHWFC